MLFDILLFNGGIRHVGIPSVEIGGVQHCILQDYSDLNYLLGNNWHCIYEHAKRVCMCIFIHCYFILACDQA